jgi:hypothetical protein
MRERAHPLRIKVNAKARQAPVFCAQAKKRRNGNDGRQAFFISLAEK